jgi:HSP20 family molecular chaperone IbpA
MLTMWNPFDELFNDAFAGYRRAPAPRAHAPAVDVREDASAYVIEADLPGFKPSDVNVSVDNRVLTVTATRQSERDDKQKGYQRVERRFGTFERAFTLPETVDAEHIEARLEEGVLTLTIPKRDVVKPRRIEVKGEGIVDKAKKVLGGEQAA